MIHKFNLLTQADDRLTVAPESDWQALEKLTPGTIVDVGGDVFADDGFSSDGAIGDTWFSLLRTVACLPLRFILTTSHAQNVLGMWDLTKRENVALMLHIERQQDCERIPDLLKLSDLCGVIGVDVTPLEDLDFTRIPTGSWAYGHVDVMSGYLCGDETEDMYDYDADPGGWVRKPAGTWQRGNLGIGWVRIRGDKDPLPPAHVRKVVQQCREAGVPVEALSFKRRCECGGEYQPMKKDTLPMLSQCKVCRKDGPFWQELNLLDGEPVDGLPAVWGQPEKGEINASN